MQSWKDKHPDFEYIFWTESEILSRGLSFECGDQISQMNEINGKADIIRWEILYKYGGFFVDADSICIEPFDDVFFDKTAFASFENENVRAGLVATGTMGFCPKHPLCRDIIDWIKSSHEAWDLIKKTRAWYSVGPALLTKMLETGNYPDFTVFPSYYFLPIHFTGPAYEGHKKVYAYQEWGTAKQSYDTMNSVVLPAELLNPPPEKWYSLLITSYNTDGRYIRECLDSIKNQTGYFGIDLVWVDDGSSPEHSADLVKYLEKFQKTSRFTRYFYLKNEINQGTAISSNNGLRYCKSPIIFKMDSDDIMLPDRMKKQLEFMTDHPDVALCGANIQTFHTIDGKKRFDRKTAHPAIITLDYLKANKPEWFINNPTICFRKNKIDAIGRYRTDDRRILYIHEDYDLAVRVIKNYGSIYNMPDVLLLYRIHPGQLTRDLHKTEFENARLRADIINR